MPPVHSCAVLCLLQVNVLVTELKSEALKERHWKHLMKKLRVSWQLHDLTLGQVHARRAISTFHLSLLLPASPLL